MIPREIIEQWLATARRYDELAVLARADGDTVAAAEYDEAARGYYVAADEAELGFEVAS